MRTRTPKVRSQAVLLLMLTALQGTQPQATARSTGREAEAVVESSSSFAIEFYRQVNVREGNVIVSPFSVYIALGMVYLGACRLAADELASALHVAQNGILHHLGSGQLMKHIGSIAGKPGIMLRMANGVWIREGYDVLPAYEIGCRKYYGSVVHRIDFRDPATSAATINRWVSEKTQKRITTLIRPDLIDPELTRLMLVNALYFKGDWHHRFKQPDTCPRTFWLSSDQKVDVPTMKQEEVFGYGETESAQILEMPYIGKDIQAVFVLPKERGDLATVEEQLTAKQVDEWQDACTPKDVRVYLPRFRIEMTLELKPVLEELGIIWAFDRRTADLANICPAEHVFLAHSVHQAGIEMNERGTEAYAATATIVREGPEDPGRVTFRANHPFLFMIVARRSGAILFMGRMNDPRE